MKRPILVLLLAAVTAVGCGTRGKTGAQGDTGPQGPPGPITDPPHITSITPEYGSSKTIFTIRGDHFGATAVEDTISVGNGAAKLTILSASPTEIRVTHAFDPVAAQTTTPISLVVANQVSNTVTVEAMPNGSYRAPDVNPIYGNSAVAIARSGSVLYIADNVRGLFAQDLASGVIRRVASPAEFGYQTVSQVYVAPDGTLYAFVNDSIGYRLVRQQSDGTWVTVTIPFSAPVAIAFGSEGDSYWVFPSEADHVLADGSIDWTAYASGGGYAGAALVSSKLYVSSSVLVNQLYVFDGSNGTRSTLDVTGAGILGAARMATDGTSLFVSDPAGFKSIDPATGVATLVGSYAGFSSFRALACEAPGKLLALDGLARVWRVTPAANSLVSVGWTTPASVVGNGGEVLAATQCVVVGGNTVGAIVALSEDGETARFVEGSTCALSLAPESGTSAVVLDAQGSVDRVNLTSGAVTTLAGIADGLTGPTGVAAAADGTIYVTDQYPFGTTRISTIADDGELQLGVASVAAALYGPAVSGSQLFLMGHDGTGYGVWAMPLPSGAVERLTPQTDMMHFAIGGNFFGAVMVSGSFAPDGAGGVYFADWDWLNVEHVSPTGDITMVSRTSSAPSGPAYAATWDPVTGNLRFVGPTVSPQAPMPMMDLFP